MFEANDSKFVTRKWNIINNQPNTNYGVGNEIMYNREVLKSNLCDYNDAYILFKKMLLLPHQPLKHKEHLKTMHYLLNVWQKLMGQYNMMLNI